MNTLSKTAKSISIDNVQYPKGIFKVRFFDADQSIALELMIADETPDANPLAKKTKFDQLVNGDTGAVFTSYASLKSWIERNLHPSTNPGYYSSSSFTEVATHATTGTTFVAFPSALCDGLQIENNTGFDIEVKKGASTSYIRIPSGMGGRFFGGIQNANELSIRRFDNVATAITIKAEAIIF